MRRLVQRAAGVVAQVLLQRQNRSRLGESTGDVVRCITWAVDEGYMRCIISKGLALRHAQDKLASSSLSDSIPDLGFNLQPPKGGPTALSGFRLSASSSSTPETARCTSAMARQSFERRRLLHAVSSQGDWHCPCAEGR